jgi:hypothetical protein
MFESFLYGVNSSLFETECACARAHATFFLHLGSFLLEYGQYMAIYTFQLFHSSMKFVNIRLKYTNRWLSSMYISLHNYNNPENQPGKRSLRKLGACGRLVLFTYYICKKGKSKAIPVTGHRGP